MHQMTAMHQTTLIRQPPLGARSSCLFPLTARSPSLASSPHRLLAVLVLLGTLLGCRSAAVEPEADEALSTGESFEASLERELETAFVPQFDTQGEALPFVPFEVADLQHQTKPITAGSTLTLDDGETRTVAEALERLNAAEAATADAGSTLRGAIAGIGQPLDPRLGAGVKEPVRYVSAVNYGLFAEQADALTAELTQPIDAVRLAADITQEQYAEWVDEGAGGPSLPADPDPAPDCEDETVEETDEYDLTLGTSDLLSAHLHADVKLVGNAERAVVVGSADAGGSLFGASFSVFDVRGRFVGPAEGPGTGHVSVSILGDDLFDGDTPDGTKHSGEYFETVRTGVRIPIANLLGVVAVTARVGVEGRAGLRFYAATTTHFARAGVTPFASTSGFAKVFAGPRIDLGIVKAKLEVGASGKLTFLEDNLTVFGSIAGRQGECLTFNWYYWGQNALEALAGRINLFAQAEGCLFGLCVGDRWVWKLFQWDGFGPLETTIFEGRD